jgi:hypothetical protein
MNSKEIREISTEPNSYGNPGHGIQKTKLRLLQEIAAQLAEQNEKLNIFFHPPLMYNTEKIDFSEIENLSELHCSLLTVNQERATLRDQFAMAALTGLLSDPESSGPKGCADAAYSYADAMMEHRK